MANRSNNGKPRRRRSTTPLDDMPGLFDYLDIDLADAGASTSDTPTPPRSGTPAHVAQTAESQDFNIDTAALTRRSSMRFISFGSGSSGNCAYLGFDTGEGRSTGILIDAGVEPTEIYNTLRDNKIDLASISGILLTHDHGDHVGYVYKILRSNKHMAVYTTMRTMEGLLRRHSISRRIKDYHHIIYIEHPFKAGGMNVTAFKTSHDGTENVGFCIESVDGAHRFVIATDTGIITPEADRYLRTANYIVIESNYDERMLANGTYPEYLKARIAGDRGHLENKVTAEYIRGIVHPGLSHVFLCHLSQENNTPEIAVETMRSALTAKGLRIGDPANPLMAADTDIALGILPRRQITPQFILRHKHP